MPPIKHALLGASSAARWIACPPSARATEHLPEETNKYAEEGTRAHEVCEAHLRIFALAGHNRLLFAESTTVISGTEKTDICAGVIRIAFSFKFTVHKQNITVFQSKKGSLAVSRIIFGKIRADIRGNLS